MPQQERAIGRAQMGLDAWLIIAGMAASGVLQAAGQRAAGAAMLGLVAAGSWINFIRYVVKWRDLRRQILLESTATAFVISLIVVLTYTAVSGVMDCDCSISPLFAEFFMLGALAASALVTWLRYR